MDALDDILGGIFIDIYFDTVIIQRFMVRDRFRDWDGKILILAIKMLSD